MMFFLIWFVFLITWVRIFTFSSMRMTSRRLLYVRVDAANQFDSHSSLLLTSFSSCSRCRTYAPVFENNSTSIQSATTVFEPIWTFYRVFRFLFVRHCSDQRFSSRFSFPYLTPVDTLFTVQSSKIILRLYARLRMFFSCKPRRNWWPRTSSKPAPAFSFPFFLVGVTALSRFPSCFSLQKNSLYSSKINRLHTQTSNVQT